MSTVDDTEDFTIALAAEPAKGEIEDIDAPASARVGTSVRVRVTVKNVGGTIGTFGVAFYEGTTDILDGVAGWEPCAPGGTITQGFTMPMPNHAWNLTAKAMRS